MKEGKKKPLVSVLMTAYNREKYIAKAIESVLKSTYENFELIIVDDRSTDRTVQITEEYVKRDKRIRLYINSTNIGQFQNRNKSAEYARGDYIKYVDSDDLIYEHGLEMMIRYMERFPKAGYGLANIPPDKSRIYPFQLSPEESYIWHFQNYPIFNKAPLSSIFRSHVFFDIGGFPYFSVCGDYAMWLHIGSKKPVVLMPQGMTWYREHPDQELQKKKNSIHIEFEYMTVEYQYLISGDCPLKPELQQKIIKENLIRQSKFIFWKLRSGHFKEYRKLIGNSNINSFSLLKYLIGI